MQKELELDRMHKCMIEGLVSGQGQRIAGHPQGMVVAAVDHTSLINQELQARKD